MIAISVGVSFLPSLSSSFPSAMISYSKQSVLGDIDETSVSIAPFPSEADILHEADWRLPGLTINPLA